VSEPAFYYMLNIKCSGGCLRGVVGPSRRSDEEFPSEVVERFFADARELGWIEDERGQWWCQEKCPGPKFDLSQFRLRSDARYKVRVINPDFFGTVTVENLEDGDGGR